MFSDIWGGLWFAPGCVLVRPVTIAVVCVCFVWLPVWLGLGNNGSYHAFSFVMHWYDFAGHVLAKSDPAGLCSQDSVHSLFSPSPESSGSMAALTPEVRAEIGAFLQKAKEGTLVQSVNGLHELLLQKKLAWRLKLTCDFIGVHPQNRDGLGISASHVQDLITNIAGIGFSRAESRCICIEVPEDARGDGCRDFNVRLASEAHGKLAPVNPAILKFASIVGSHANQAGRCFWYGMPHPDEKVTINGALSLEKLAKIDPAWTSSIREGLDWMVVSAQIVDAFPEYVGLAQSAGNAAGQIASAEGELQLARKVNQAIADFLARGGKDTVSYTDVSGAILRSKPPSASALPGIFTFVLRYGGGAGPDSFLSRSETFIRAHGYAARSLGSDFWQAMGAEIKGSADQKVIWRHMILKLAFCGPEKILQLGDIRRAMSAKDILNKASEAEKLAIRMTGLLSAEPKLTAQVVAATMAEVEMEFVAVIFQKKKFTNRTSLEQVCHDCLTGLGLASPFASAVTGSSPASSPSKEASSGSCMGCIESVCVCVCMLSLLLVELLHGADVHGDINR